MKIQIFKTVSTLIVLSLVLFFCNKLLLEYTNFSSFYKQYQFSLEFIYSILSLFSITILIIMLFVNQKNKDIVGMTFMLSTTFKTIICFVIFSSIINSSNQNKIEKINFFLVFILFLTIETLITIRLLNKKQ